MAAQHLCSHLNPSFSCLSSGTKRSAGKSDWDPFKFLPFWWFSEHVRFCGHPLRAKYLYPTAFKFCHIQVLLAFKAKHNGGSYSQCKTPGLGSLLFAQTLCSLRRTFWNCDYPSFCRLPPWVMGLHYTMSLCSFFISLVLKNIFCQHSGYSHRELLCQWL